MLVAFFAHWSAFFMKIALWLSHLKFQAAIVTGNIHHIATHMVYTHVYKIARPALMWSPV